MKQCGQSALSVQIHNMKVFINLDQRRQCTVISNGLPFCPVTTVACVAKEHNTTWTLGSFVLLGLLDISFSQKCSSLILPNPMTQEQICK